MARAHPTTATKMQKLISEGDNGGEGGDPRNRRSTLGAKAVSNRVSAKAANRTHCKADNPDWSGGASNKKTKTMAERTATPSRMCIPVCGLMVECLSVFSTAPGRPPPNGWTLTLRAL